MRKAISIHRSAFSLLVLAVLLAAGCASLEVAAYRATGTVAVSVDGAMRAWGDYIRAGHASANDEVKVRAAYEKYQATMAVAERAILAYKTAPNDAALQTAVRNASLAGGAVIELIRVFCPEVQPAAAAGGAR